MNLRNLLPVSRRPDLLVLSSGRIDIAARVVRLLGIRPGDVVSVMEGDGEFYLYIAARAESLVGRHKAQCFPSSRRGSHFRLWSRTLASAILRECGGVSRAALPAGQLSLLNDLPVIPIITRNNLCNHD